MSQSAQTRNPEREQDERDSYIALLHAYNLSVEVGDTLPRERIEADLGLPRERAATMVRMLSDCGYMEVAPSGREIRLTGRGRRYLECGAGRRRSVRPRKEPTSDRPEAPR